MKSLPTLTILLTAIATQLFAAPAGAPFLVYERDHITQIWRFMTSHFVHWGFEHFFWSVGTFLVLGFLSEREDRRAFLVSIILSALAIPLALCFLAPNLSVYGGLSGIDSALFVLIAVRLVMEKRREGDTLLVVGGTAVLVAFLGKIGFEFFAHEPVFVSENTGLTPVPLAHLVGGLAGAAVAIWPRRPTSDLPDEE